MNFSIEKIYHFVCEKCDLWWSIATDGFIMTHSMTCPHCSNKHEPPHRDISLAFGNSQGKRSI
jgi:hypothetical protein